MAVSEAQFDLMRNRVIELERSYAVREESLKTVNDRLGRIESTLSRITWLIVTAIIVAAMTFIMNGGLMHTGVT
jgi:hypothetical protein